MSTKPYSPQTDQQVFDDGKRLANVVPVRLRAEHLRRDADARQFHLSDGDAVVVESRFGPLLADVIGPVERKKVADDTLLRVLRKANDADLKRAEDNAELETTAYRFALERIRDRELPMKLIRTRVMQDRSRIIFYFSAEGRIDFRALVRDLAGRFKTRIEMRQIGVRDGAQLLGGLGPCGRELCCSTFLNNFEPISIRIAKDQGLTLNPDKISGMCGRLMCCLVYEQKLYRRLKTELPEAGRRVTTTAGDGVIDQIDVIARQVTVTLDDGQRRSVDLDDVELVDPGGREESDEDQDTEEKLWDGDPPRKRGGGDNE